MPLEKISSSPQEFSGVYSSTLDSKGRIYLPQKFMHILEKIDSIRLIYGKNRVILVPESTSIHIPREKGIQETLPLRSGNRIMLSQTIRSIYTLDTHAPCWIIGKGSYIELIFCEKHLQSTFHESDTLITEYAGAISRQLQK